MSQEEERRKRRLRSFPLQTVLRVTISNPALPPSGNSVFVFFAEHEFRKLWNDRKGQENERERRL
jgi:hypothetical protein